MLPTLIFVETHIDKKSQETLNYLIPLLAQRGYLTFHEEGVVNCIDIAIDSCSNVIEDLELEYASIKEARDEYKDVYSEDDNEMIRRYRERPLQAREFIWIMHCIGLNKGDELMTTKARLDGYLLLEKNNIKLVGIDDVKGNKDSGVIHNKFKKNAFKGCGLNELEEKELYREEKESYELREFTMTMAYAGIQEPVIGRIGINHLKPIQERLLLNMSQEVVAKKYLFFYIHSELSMLKFINLLSNQIELRDEFFKEQQTLFLPDSKSFPLGLNIFDTQSMSASQIYEAIDKLIADTVQDNASNTLSPSANNHEKELVTDNYTTSFFKEGRRAAQLNESFLPNPDLGCMDKGL